MTLAAPGRGISTARQALGFAFSLICLLASLFATSLGVLLTATLWVHHDPRLATWCAGSWIIALLCTLLALRLLRRALNYATLPEERSIPHPPSVEEATPVEQAGGF